MTAAFELSIIVPCYNEGENVLELAERAQAMFTSRGVAGEVVFVNDASTDHTGRLIDELAARHDFVQAVHHEANRGIPGGWDSGVRAARGRLVAIMDGDLQYLPEDVYRLYRRLREGTADIVQGWRSHIGRPRDFRYTMSRVLHWMLRVLFGLRLHDIKSGFLVCDREIFAHILRHRFHYYYFQTFIAISAHHKGYRIEDIEALFEERKLGESFIAAFPWKMILKNLVDLGVGFVEFRLLRRHTDVLGDFLAGEPPALQPAPLPIGRRLALRAFGALMPLHHWKHSPTALRYYHQLRRTQWLPAARLRALQDTRLRTLLRHAYRHVPYYREVLDRAGLTPDDFQSVQDLPRLPVLTRTMLRQNLYFDCIADTHDKRQMLPLATSGAHGQPLTTYADRQQLEMRWAAAQRAGEWAGYRFGDPQVQLWQLPAARPRRQVWRERLASLLARRTVLPAAALSADGTRALADAALRAGPTTIEGDAAALALAATARTDAGAGRPAAPPRAVLSSQQTLSPALRQAIEAGFGAPVQDRYGSRELGLVAQQCEAGGYHVNAESYVVEIVRDGRPVAPGEVGDLVVTDLNNVSVPLIRYALGDRAVAATEPCPCGRALPLLQRIEGRAAAVIVGANGAVVPGSFFGDLFKDANHLLREFRVAQTVPGRLELRLVRAARFTEAALERLLAVVRQHLGSDLAIDVQYADALAPGEGGVHGTLRLPAAPAEQPAAAARS